MADLSVELTMFLSSPACTVVASEMSIKVKMRFIKYNLVSDLKVDAGFG
jgi:hypothetical protein